MNKQIIYFPKDGQPTLIPNTWQVWDGERDEGGIPDLEHGLSKVLVPFHWWITHHKNADVIERAHKGEIGVWFAADDDILKHVDIIEEGKSLWPVVGAHFPIFRDGRSFSTRRVQAFQNDQAIFSMIASFQDTDPGLDHQDAFPADIPDPETLPTAAELLGDSEHPVVQYWAKARPFDMRHVTSPIYFKVDGEHVAHQAVWLKALGTLPDDPQIHRAAMAYASDYSILESIYRRHGIAWSHRGLKSASLDHAMWFHRDGRADEWMLYVQESPSAQGGRGLSLGRIFNRAGVLLATVAQEGMVRVPELD
mgnify:CR=1 FL=1